MSEQLKINGVVTARVGQPRNNGSAGRGLYAVPIRLSRQATAREAQLLLHHWDRPPQWTMMHRPGIASVIGDLFTLDGTTIDEVKRCHAATLKLVVEATNRDEAALRAEDQRDAAERAQAEADHRRHVESIANYIEF